MHRLKKRVTIIKLGGDAFEDTHPTIMKAKVMQWIRFISSAPDVARYKEYYAHLEGIEQAVKNEQYLTLRDFKKFIIN